MYTFVKFTSAFIIIFPCKLSNNVRNIRRISLNNDTTATRTRGGET